MNNLIVIIAAYIVVICAGGALGYCIRQAVDSYRYHKMVDRKLKELHKRRRA